MRGKSKAIVEQLVREISEGRYPPLGRFPSERSLSERFGVARGTIQLAVDELKRRGLIYVKNAWSTHVVSDCSCQTRKIGVLTSGARYSEIFTRIGREIVMQASAEGVETVEGDASASDDGKVGNLAVRLARRMVNAGVQGVILQPVEFAADEGPVNKELLRIFSEASIPVVLLDCDAVRSPARSMSDLVTLDNFTEARILATHFSQRGVRRVAFIARKNCPDSVRYRIAGVKSVFGERNTDVVSVEDVRNLASMRLALAQMPEHDGMICQNDVTAVTVARALSELGLSVPRHVMLAGFDDVGLAREMRPQLTTIRQPCAEIAKVAFSRLMNRMKDPLLVPLTILLRGELVLRGSTDLYRRS